MKVKVEIFKNTVGDGGQMLDAGKVYEVKPRTATTLIQAGKAKFSGSLVKIKSLFDDVLSGIKFGEALEMPADSAEKLIKNFRAEIPYDETDDSGDGDKINVLIVQDTFVKGAPLFAGKTHLLKPSEAALLVGTGRATFPDSVKRVELKFNKPVIFGGGSYKEKDLKEFAVPDAEALIRKGVAEPVSLVSDSAGGDD
jgi:hypothetical protein